MSHQLWLSLVFVGFFTTSVRTAEQGPVVRLETGPIRGEALPNKVRAFRGVPFAAPPVGDLRWRPPRAVKPWTDIRDCQKFAPACPQPESPDANGDFSRQSEDCLYLNVWTAASEPSERRPVMVWIHGGGNVIGAAYSPIYDGKHLAEAGVILVSIQYRLGVFGYLAHPSLTAEAKARDGHEASGNYGLMDQIAALQWVKASISAFGGDPDRVTIFGESAGAANVTHLMASPLARGLFHRAIAESGYYGEEMTRLDQGSDKFPSAHQVGLDVAARLGVKGEGEDALKDLRSLSVERLRSVPVTLATLNFGKGKGVHVAPNVDGYVLPRSSAEIWADGKMARVPFMAGSNLDDGGVFSRGLPIQQQQGFKLVLNKIFGADADEAGKLIPVAKDEDVAAATKRLCTILAFRAPARRLVRQIEAVDSQAWLYEFTRNPGKGRTAKEGVVHGLEIAYVFGTFSAFGDETDKALSADMMHRWVLFAGDGDPNGATKDKVSPNWPTYRKSDDKHLEFGNKVTVGEKLDRDLCDLADKGISRREKK